MDQDTIKVGDYVIVQRQTYTKLHKLKEHGNLVLGPFNVEMDSVIGARYFDTFLMRNVPNTKKFYTLEKVDERPASSSNLSIENSGIDNRDIEDDGQSQMLSRHEIDQLKDGELNSNNIVEKLITNSKTFNSKTEFSQEKYIKKKEKKYFEYLQILKPSIRLLAHMYYRQDPSKTLGIRIDDLSQILSYSNIQSEGNHILYDSGTSGLMSAALMHAIGAETSGKLIHMHPGNECQKNALIAMQFPAEQVDRCINVNLYSVLRYHQRNIVGNVPGEETSLIETENTENENEPESKKRKLNDKPSWQFDNEKACVLLKDKVDSLIIVLKEHPINIVKELSQFLNAGRSLVVFSIYRESLQDLYMYLKSTSNYVSIRVTSNFMRNYQVLPERTHPEVNMSSGGFVLSAYKIDL